MAEVQSNEEFEHYHGDGIKNIRLEEARLAEARKANDLSGLDIELEVTLKGVREKLTKSLPRGPEHVFKQAMKSLKEVDAKRFIIENALEALKNGKSYADIVKLYRDLNFLPPADAPPGNKPQPTTSPPTENEPLPLHATLALLERKSILERVTTSVMQVGVNALKTVPKWIEIEPTVGFAGPVPMISFTLKGKGMSAYEFFEALRGEET